MVTAMIEPSIAKIITDRGHDIATVLDEDLTVTTETIMMPRAVAESLDIRVPAGQQAVKVIRTMVGFTYIQHVRTGANGYQLAPTEA